MFSTIVEFIKTYLTGFVAAMFSTAFATYMLVNGEVSQELPDTVVKHMPVVNPLDGKLASPSVPKHSKTTDVPLLELEQIFTGSIQRPARKTRTTSAKKEDFKAIHQRKPTDPTRSYVLRIATAEMALVEGRGRLWNVSPGQLLPGVGRVLAITKRHSKWVVTTTYGDITE